MKPELQLAAQLASNYVESLDDTRDICKELDPTVLRSLLQKELQEHELDPSLVISELHRDASPGIMNSGGGNYFGFVIGGALPVSIGTEWLVSAWDQNAGAYFVAPSAAICEEVVGEWLKDLFQLPQHASFALVTGCQAAHTTALAAARYYLLSQKNYNVEEMGLIGAPVKIRVLVGEHHHETLLRAMRFLGIGTKALVEIQSDPETGRMNVETLRQELEKDQEKYCTIVACAAGDLNRGEFDPIQDICKVAHEYGAWVHVDGAFGMWAATSPKYQHLVKGIGMADSWATDTHKWLNVPQDSGVAFCRHVNAHKASMNIYAPYAIQNNNDTNHHSNNQQEQQAVVFPPRDEYHFGPEWSRRARGFAVYAALRCLGRNGIAKLVESCCESATALVEGLAELDGVEVLAHPIINQGLVRFLDQKTSKNHDARTNQVIENIKKSEQVWFGGTTWHGMHVMRISVCSHRTTMQHVEKAITIVRQALAQE